MKSVTETGMSSEVALHALTGELGLLDKGLNVTKVKLIGHGSRAMVEIQLSNGEKMEFATVKTIAGYDNLSTELGVAAGIGKNFTKEEKLAIVILIRQAAELLDRDGEVGRARSWGETYLQDANYLDVDMTDKAERWAAFDALDKSIKGTPWLSQKQVDNHDGAQRKPLVLRDYSGVCYVHSGDFYNYALVVHHATEGFNVVARMLQSGWERPTANGKIQATDPESGRKLRWLFYAVPGAWGDDENSAK